jgi:hypothetical protein
MGAFIVTPFDISFWSFDNGLIHNLVYKGGDCLILKLDLPCVDSIVGHYETVTKCNTLVGYYETVAIRSNPFGGRFWTPSESDVVARLGVLTKEKVLSIIECLFKPPSHISLGLSPSGVKACW